MTMDEDRDGFAAEYVLGTLDSEERAQADALVLVDQDFAAKVRQWERRLGELNVLVAPVEPSAPVWERIKASLASTGQAEHLHLPEVATPPMRQDAPTAEIVQMTQRMQRGVPQANGTVIEEPTMDVQNVARAVVFMATVTPEANVQFLTVMATKMPFVGRG